ncbi:MarR family transcriptional regulator [Tumebacillus sp. ITR2]|uniref:MarR family transcriptional regulator n=1 Tax=Tumebacillus amylolyticus TaxID=2801339 RepID=A0ABS1JFZ1_9BACL|nr:MarR family transcriptional regulator [Tumebacillus amylolyticus]MBL0389189.1 MarR family transcriptional regulator [Tumebacillus amylolyticus]
MDDMTEIIASFRELKRVFFRLVHQDAEAVGITPVQLMVIRNLAQHQDITLNELAEKTQLTASTMSGVVERLVKAGLVERERSEQDRRALVLHVTDAGREKLSVAFGPQSTFQRRLAAGRHRLSEEEIRELLRLHHELITILTTEEGEPQK